MLAVGAIAVCCAKWNAAGRAPFDGLALKSHCGRKPPLQERPDAIKCDEIVGFDPEEQALIGRSQDRARVAEINEPVPSRMLDGAEEGSGSVADLFCNSCCIRDQHKRFGDMFVHGGISLI